MTHMMGIAGAYALAWARLKKKLLEFSHFSAEPGSQQDSGKVLDEITRVEMESAFGYDLRDVRIHRTKQAGELARKLQAEAFTIGTDIFAAEGKLSSETGEGKGLLVHELTHVIQQTHPKTTIPISNDSTELEMLHIPRLPFMPANSGYPDRAPVLAPQFATSGSAPASRTATSQQMETEAQTAEQTMRSTSDSTAEEQDRAAQVDAEEIANLVYRLMQQELLVERDRTRR